MITRGRGTTSSRSTTRPERQGRRRPWAPPAALLGLLALVGVMRVLPRGASTGDPAQAPSLYQLGMGRRQEGDLRGAAEAFRGAASVLPQWPAAHLQLGITYAEAREYELARQELERAVELAPEEAVAWGQLGKLQLVTRQLDQAERALQRAIQLQPDRASYPALLGEVYRQRGDPASTRKAIALFRQALALQPEDGGFLSPAGPRLPAVRTTGRGGGGAGGGHAAGPSRRGALPRALPGRAEPGSRVGGDAGAADLSEAAGRFSRGKDAGSPASAAGEVAIPTGDRSADRGASHARMPRDRRVPRAPLPD